MIKIKLPKGIKVKSSTLKDLKNYIPIKEVSDSKESIGIINGLPVYVDDDIERAYEWIY